MISKEELKDEIMARTVHLSELEAEYKLWQAVGNNILAYYYLDSIYNIYLEEKAMLKKAIDLAQEVYIAPYDINLN